jgi:signal transduction histidine kinase
MADNEVKRVAHIAKQTLGFYREQSAPSLVNPAEVLDDVLELLDSKIVQKRLCVERRYRTKLAVLAVPGEIRQVLSNLLSNGIEAVGNGGRITIKVSSSRQWTPPFPRGARITISDTGHGITGENLTKIFEPFFTTKQHAGTGLGLWVSRQIVGKHGGSIAVRSSTRAPRQGTTFSVFLPLEGGRASDKVSASEGPSDLVRRRAV